MKGLRFQKNDYPFFLKDCSYIGCTSLVEYSDNEVDKIAKDECFEGCLSKQDIQSLINHISKSEILEERHIKMITNALEDAL